jgi:hypothetical protein
MPGESGGAQRIAENPFYVLGVDPRATRAEVEREGQKLLGMLELGLGSAATCETPLGPRPRTAEDVRRALAELRIPERRLVHELWARLPAAHGRVASGPATGGTTARASSTLDSERPAPAPWPAALVVLGWAFRRDAR